MPTWLAAWPGDNPTLFSLVVLAFLVAIVVVLRITLRDQREQWATAASAIVIPLALTVILSHALAQSRDRDGRRWTLAQDHLRRLKAVLQAEAATLAEVAQRAERQGAALLSRAENPGSTRDEMEARFSPDPLSGDLKNHYSTYAENKSHLRSDVEEQDRQYADLVSHLVKTVAGAAPVSYRGIVARAYVSKCMGLGPGMTVRSDDKSHSSSWNIGSSNTSSSGGGPAPSEMLEAFRVFAAIRSDSKTVNDCASLKAWRVKIIDDAKKLSTEARILAERTTLSGACEYTRLN